TKTKAMISVSHRTKDDATRSTLRRFLPRRYIDSTRATENVTMPGRSSHTAHALSANSLPKKSTTTKGADRASSPPAMTASSVTTRHTTSVVRSPSSGPDEATHGARTLPAASARYQTISVSP